MYYYRRKELRVKVVIEASSCYDAWSEKHQKHQVGVLATYNILLIYHISRPRPIRRTVIFSLEILGKNNDECILRRCIQKSEDNAHNTQVACSSRVSR